MMSVSINIKLKFYKKNTLHSNRCLLILLPRFAQIDDRTYVGYDTIIIITGVGDFSSANAQNYEIYEHLISCLIDIEMCAFRSGLTTRKILICRIQTDVFSDTVLKFALFKGIRGQERNRVYNYNSGITRGPPIGSPRTRH